MISESYRKNCGMKQIGLLSQSQREKFVYFMKFWFRWCHNVCERTYLFTQVHKHIDTHINPKYDLSDRNSLVFRGLLLVAGLKHVCQYNDQIDGDLSFNKSVMSQTGAELVTDRWQWRKTEGRKSRKTYLNNRQRTEAAEVRSDGIHAWTVQFFTTANRGRHRAQKMVEWRFLIKNLLGSVDSSRFAGFCLKRAWISARRLFGGLVTVNE